MVSKAVCWDGTNIEEVMEVTGMPGVTQVSSGDAIEFPFHNVFVGNVAAEIGDYIVRDGFDKPFVLNATEFSYLYDVTD